MPGKCKFQDSWLSKGIYKDWLLKDVQDIHFARCRACCKSIKLQTMGEAALTSHAGGAGHKAAVRKLVQGSLAFIYKKHARTVRKYTYKCNNICNVLLLLEKAKKNVCCCQLLRMVGVCAWHQQLSERVGVMSVPDHHTVCTKITVFYAYFFNNRASKKKIHKFGVTGYV